MTTKRKNALTAKEENVDEAVPPKAPQNPQDPIEEAATLNV